MVTTRRNHVDRMGEETRLGTVAIAIHARKRTHVEKVKGKVVGVVLTCNRKIHRKTGTYG